ncbi:SAD2 [Scenedesmus sp. PABB004]|nr:SAD2 [Scenedesmus sp. PABB004]
MDVQALCSVLQGCLSANQEERKAAEALLKQAELQQGQVVNLLRVAGEPSVDISVRQVASISFKQVAKRHWEPEKDGAPVLHAGDKQLVRDNLLEAIITAPHIIQSQLSEVMSTVVYCDYPEAWPGLLEAVMKNLTANDQSRMYGALLVLRVLARKYEFRDDEERAPLAPIIAAAFPVLLGLMQQLVAAPAPSPQGAEFMKLICKVFWSATFMSVPELLLQQEQFSGWMMCLHQAMRKPLPWDQLPPGVDERRKWIYFKALKWVLHITYRLFNRYGEPRLCNAGTDQQFAQMFEAHVSSQFLEDQLHVLHPLASGHYLAPRVTNLALQYLTRALELKSTYKQVKPHVEPLLSQVVLPLMCFDAEDAELWEEDPQEFVRKGYDVLEDMLGTKTAAGNFVQTLAQKKPKSHLPWLLERLVGVMNAHDAAVKAAAAGGPPVPEALARQMDGAMLAIGAISGTLKSKARRRGRTRARAGSPARARRLCPRLNALPPPPRRRCRAQEPYRSQLESLLSAHVLPTFTSPHGHLRAKAAWLAKEFADIQFGGGGALFNTLLQAVINSLHDGELPVRVEGVMALRSFVEELEDPSPLKPVLAQLMDSIFKLMSEVENEELVFTLEVLVDKFGDEIAPYAVSLAENLTAAFWKYSGQADGDEEGDDDDQAAVAAYGCLKALNTLLDGVSEMKHLLPVLEGIIHPIMAKCIGTDGQDVLEDVLELLAYFTYFGELTPRLWSLWPQLHALVMDFGIDYWENILIPLDNFISRGTDVFLLSESPNYQESVFAMAQVGRRRRVGGQTPAAAPATPRTGGELSRARRARRAQHTLTGDFDELSVVPAVKLMEVVLQNCTGKVDRWLQPYLQLALAKLNTAENRLLKDELLCLVANALYYNAPATLSILQGAGVVQQLFGVWFAAIFARSKKDKPAHFKAQQDKKVTILGLLALMGNTPDAALPPEVAGGLPQLLSGLVRLLLDLKAQQEAAAEAAEEEAEEEEAEEEDDDAVADDDDDAALEEDDAYMKRLRRQALKLLRGDGGGGDDDDDSDDEWTDDEETVGTPLDDIDPFVSFADVLGGLQASNPGRYAALLAGADAGVLGALQGMQAFAAEQRAKKAAEAAAAAAALQASAADSALAAEELAGAEPRAPRRAVVTSFVRRDDGALLLVRRSAAVSTYQHQWGGVSGGVEGSESLLERALIEIEEEVGLVPAQLELVCWGRPLPVDDGQRRFLVHPFLFQLGAADAPVTLNWENEDFAWVRPSAIKELPHVPLLPETVRRLLLPQYMQVHVDYLRQDRAHGAAELAAYVLQALRAAAALEARTVPLPPPAAAPPPAPGAGAECAPDWGGPPGAGGAAADGSGAPAAAAAQPSFEGVMEAYRNFCFHMAVARPSMAAVANAAVEVMLALEREVAARADAFEPTAGIARVALSDTLGKLAEQLQRQQAATIANTAAVIRPGTRVMTTSLSSTVAKALIQAHRAALAAMDAGAAGGADAGAAGGAAGGAGAGEGAGAGAGVAPPSAALGGGAAEPPAPRAALSPSLDLEDWVDDPEFWPSASGVGRDGRGASSSWDLEFGPRRGRGDAASAGAAGAGSGAAAPRGVSVVVCEARPLCEGVSMARRLAAAGLAVTLITDAQAGAFMDEVDLVLLGADGVTPGGVVNKVGSRLLALAAKASGVPVVAVTDSLKISPGPVSAVALPNTRLAAGEEEKEAEELLRGWAPEAAAAVARLMRAGGGAGGAGGGAGQQQAPARQAPAQEPAQEEQLPGGGGGSGGGDASALAPGGSLEVRNVYFERVPLSAVTGLITDKGFLSSFVVGQLIKQRARDYRAAFGLVSADDDAPPPAARQAGLGGLAESGCRRRPLAARAGGAVPGAPPQRAQPDLLPSGDFARIKKSVFVGASVDLKGCPPQSHPEFAVIGRSNVGKSSLINMLTQNSKLARTSKEPGMTKTINHYLINDSWYLVDLPGYGYAKTAGKAARAGWLDFTKDYFIKRSALVAVLLLVDASLPPQGVDLDCAAWLAEAQVPFAVVFTKTDARKKGGPAPGANMRAFQAALLESYETLPDCFATSAAQGTGRSEATRLHYTMARKCFLAAALCVAGAGLHAFYVSRREMCRKACLALLAEQHQSEVAELTEAPAAEDAQALAAADSEPLSADADAPCDTAPADAAPVDAAPADVGTGEAAAAAAGDVAGACARGVCDAPAVEEEEEEAEEEALCPAPEAPALPAIKARAAEPRANSFSDARVRSDTSPAAPSTPARGSDEDDAGHAARTRVCCTVGAQGAQVPAAASFEPLLASADAAPCNAAPANVGTGEAAAAGDVEAARAVVEEEVLRRAPEERLDRIAENRRRMEEMGVLDTARDLMKALRPVKPAIAKKPRAPRQRRPKRRHQPVRRSRRLDGTGTEFTELEREEVVTYSDFESGLDDILADCGEIESMPAEKQEAFQEMRCASTSRGTMYDSVVGITCHFCRQKKLCGEEGCPRCSRRSTTAECIGKSDCARCQGATGRFCRACLLLRYGQTLEDVRKEMAAGTWLCPHCYEDEHPEEGWMCNSSICMKRRGFKPTGIAIYDAQQRGFPSVAHWLQAQLKRRGVAAVKAGDTGDDEPAPRGASCSQGSSQGSNSSDKEGEAAAPAVASAPRATRAAAKVSSPAAAAKAPAAAAKPPAAAKPAGRRAKGAPAPASSSGAAASAAADAVQAPGTPGRGAESAEPGSGGRTTRAGAKAAPAPAAAAAKRACVGEAANARRSLRFARK